MITEVNEKNTKMLSAVDLVEMGFSRAVAYQLLNRADFPAVRIGRRLFVRYDRLMAWLEEHEGGQTVSD